MEYPGDASGAKNEWIFIYNMKNNEKELLAKLNSILYDVFLFVSKLYLRI